MNMTRAEVVLYLFRDHCYTGKELSYKFWSEENVKIILKHLYEVNEITDKGIIKKGLKARLYEMKLDKLYNHVKNSSFDYVSFITDGRIKSSQLPKHRKLVNKKQLRTYCISLCKERGWKSKDVPTRFKVSYIPKDIRMGYSDVDIIKIAFPNMNIFEFTLPSSAWEDIEFLKGYVKYIVEEKNGLKTKEEINVNVTQVMFRQSILRKYSLKELIELTYPFRYNPEDYYELKKVRQKRKTVNKKCTTKKELRDYMLDYLYVKNNYTDEYLLENFDRHMVPSFIRNNYTFDEVINITFAGKYDRWDFRRTKQTKWTGDVIDRYIKWAIKRYNITILDIHKDIFILPHVNTMNVKQGVAVTLKVCEYVNMYNQGTVTKYLKPISIKQ